MSEIEALRDRVQELNKKVDVLESENMATMLMLLSFVSETAKHIDKEHKGKDNVLYKDFLKTINVMQSKVALLSPQVESFYQDLLQSAFGGDHFP